MNKALTAPPGAAKAKGHFDPRKGAATRVGRGSVEPGVNESEESVERVDYESMVVQEFLNGNDRGEVDVSPWYQRRAVWTTAQKAYLVNSLFETMPVPSIYIRHVLDLENEKTVKEIVDGQQRIRSIIDYRAGAFAARHPDHARRVRYEELTSSQRHDFLMAKLPVAYLIGADDSDVIEIFGRLNAVSKTLNAQEKRSAKHSGEFHQFCLREAASRVALWRELGIFSATEISRMAEVQFTAEVAMAMIAGLTDFSASRVDKAYAEWDEDFPEREQIGAKLERVYRVVAAIDPDAVKETIFSRSPVFYSLLLVLDGMTTLPSRGTLETALHDIDSHFNDPRPAAERPQADLDFVAACTASTQRIRSRQIRHDFISGFING